MPKKRGRKPGLVKTKTTKKRKLEIYFPTERAKEMLFEAAEARDMTASRYVLSCLEEAGSGDREGPSPKATEKYRSEIEALKAQIEVLRKENQKLMALIDRNGVELSLLRTREVPIRGAPVKQGVRSLNGRLVALLKTREVLSGEDLIEELDLNLMDKDAVQAIWKDLDTLTSHGLVEPTMEGWRWLGE